MIEDDAYNCSGICHILNVTVQIIIHEELGTPKLSVFLSEGWIYDNTPTHTVALAKKILTTLDNTWTDLCLIAMLILQSEYERRHFHNNEGMKWFVLNSNTDKTNWILHTREHKKNYQG